MHPWTRPFTPPSSGATPFVRCQGCSSIYPKKYLAPRFCYPKINLPGLKKHPKKIPEVNVYKMQCVSNIKVKCPFAVMLAIAIKYAVLVTVYESIIILFLKVTINRHKKTIATA